MSGGEGQGSLQKEQELTIPKNYVILNLKQRFMTGTMKCTLGIPQEHVLRDISLKSLEVQPKCTNHIILHFTFLLQVQSNPCAKRVKGLAFLSLDASFHKMQAVLEGGWSRFGGGGEGMSGEIKAGPGHPWSFLNNAGSNHPCLTSFLLGFKKEEINK